MRTLTGMGGLGNAQELAELLRQMGRGPDSMLSSYYTRGSADAS
jgi:hypothetical protein